MLNKFETEYNIVCSSINRIKESLKNYQQSINEDSDETEIQVTNLENEVTSRLEQVPQKHIIRKKISQITEFSTQSENHIFDAKAYRHMEKLKSQVTTRRCSLVKNDLNEIHEIYKDSERSLLDAIEFWNEAEHNFSIKDVQQKYQGMIAIK